MTETHKIRSPEWSHIHERDNRIIELEAIVDRLPKCWRLDESGKRVQDVPVVPETELWRHCEECDAIHVFHVLLVYRRMRITRAFSHICGSKPPSVADCCATPKAAQAAREVTS